MKRTQVVVAGAGPVGGVAALALADRGVDVLLLEANATCALDLRASTFHPPTLDIMAEMGLLEALEAQGLRAPVYQYRNRETGAIISFDLGEIADYSRHPYRLQCEQWKLARLAADRLAQHPHGAVAFQRRVVSYSEDETGITVHAEAPFAIESYRCDYLIATDGANSIIRKWLGIEFDGFTYPEKFLCLSTTWPVERHFEDLALVNYVADPREWAVILRAPTAWRILVPAAESDDDAWLSSDDKKNQVFRGLIGEDEAVRTEHRTIYRVHQRVARTYRQGRILLAGDAAHLNNPLGGFGMNSGIHDAWNVADALARVLKDGEPDALLDRYDRQRRTVMHEFVQAQTIRNKQALEAGSAETAERREEQLRRTAEDPVLRREYLLTQSMYRAREREAAIA